MKTLRQLTFAMIIALAFASCGSNKQMVNNQQQPQPTPAPPTTMPTPQPTPQPTEQQPTLGKTTLKVQGTDMIDELSEDGLSIRKVAYKWYAGIGTADKLQAATELAEREARATISRVITTAVLDEAERGNVGNNGNVQQALRSHWEQVSMSIQNACEPIGDAKIDYDQQTKMYTVTQKVGIRGDRFLKMIENAGNYEPTTLKGDELKQFIDVNKSIMEAAKGN